MRIRKIKYIRAWCRFSVGDSYEIVRCSIKNNYKSIYGKNGNTFGPYFTTKKKLKEYYEKK